MCFQNGEMESKGFEEIPFPFDLRKVFLGKHFLISTLVIYGSILLRLPTWTIKNLWLFFLTQIKYLQSWLLCPPPSCLVAEDTAIFEIRTPPLFEILWGNTYIFVGYEKGKRRAPLWQADTQNSVWTSVIANPEFLATITVRCVIVFTPIQDG